MWDCLIARCQQKRLAVKKPIQVQYVALGDSLAAGQTPTGYIDSGYPDYIVKNFKGQKYKLVDYDNYGIPGYTSDQLKNDILKSYKIRKEVKQATHITIDIGANDFLSVLKQIQIQFWLWVNLKSLNLI